MIKMSATKAIKKKNFFKWYLVLDKFSITVSTNSNGCKWQGGRGNEKAAGQKTTGSGSQGLGSFWLSPGSTLDEYYHLRMKGQYCQILKKFRYICN